MKVKQHIAKLGLDADEIFNHLPENLTLSVQDGVLSLYESQNPRSPLSVDFLHGSLSYRSKQHLGAEHLIKACQLKGQSAVRILDGTCGLGSDSFLLYQAGFKVTAIEKNPLIHALLTDGLRRYQLAENNPGFTLIKGDFLSHKAQEPYQVIYLDPMFPATNKSAKNKKTMQLFQAIHQDKVDDASLLLNHALQSLTQRVVVKRPSKSSVLTSYKPTFQVSGKTCRFDAYQIA